MGVTCSVISDGKPECWLAFHDLNTLGRAFDVREYEVVQADLASEEFVHVDFVRVECTKQNLIKITHINKQTKKIS